MSFFKRNIQETYSCLLYYSLIWCTHRIDGALSSRVSETKWSRMHDAKWNRNITRPFWNESWQCNQCMKGLQCWSLKKHNGYIGRKQCYCYYCVYWVQSLDLLDKYISWTVKRGVYGPRIIHCVLFQLIFYFSDNCRQSTLLTIPAPTIELTMSLQSVEYERRKKVPVNFILKAYDCIYFKECWSVLEQKVRLCHIQDFGISIYMTCELWIVIFDIYLGSNWRNGGNGVKWLYSVYWILWTLPCHKAHTMSG